MIPPEFDYQRASSVDEAISALGQGGEDAKLLAGGHSLLPLMKLRLAAPSLLVDIGGIGELRGIDRADGGWRIGALTTHAMLQSADELGVLAKAASLIADQQVRNRGTIGGSLAHGDPASDLPAVALALEGEVTAQAAGGERRIPAAELFQDFLTTALAPDEVLTAVHLPALEGDGRRGRARQGERRHLRGRPHRADAHGHDPAAGQRGGGGAARAVAERGEHRRRRRAGRRGD